MSRECDALLANTSAAENKPVGITADVMTVTVQHEGRDVDIMLIQDNLKSMVALVYPAYKIKW